MQTAVVTSTVAANEERRSAQSMRETAAWLRSKGDEEAIALALGFEEMAAEHEGLASKFDAMPVDRTIVMMPVTR